MTKNKNVRRLLSTRLGALLLLLPVAVGAASSPSQLPTVAGTSGLVSLPGHIHRLARQQFDAGDAPDSLAMGGLELIIAKTPAQQLALDKLVAEQSNPKAPQYHRFLTPAGYGSQFGASEATMAALSGWLKSNGLQVGSVPAGRGHLPFFGSKMQIEAAFHTQIHLFNVNGQSHFANISDPMIPAALKPMIVSVRGLNDFHPTAGAKSMRAHAGLPNQHSSTSSPDTYYPGSNQYPGYVGPTDFATMYNLSPEYQSGITGAGVTIALAEQSDISASVLTTFWTAFAVAGSNFGLPAQQFSSIPVPVSAGGTDPGETNQGNEDESYLDTEIVGGLAPGAKLILVRDKSALNASQYIIDQNLAGVLNVSFSQCEFDEMASNSAINSMWQQAASEGITVIVSSGDSGIAQCTAQADIGKAKDVNASGVSVNGIASTPYDLAVGGTDFDPTMETPYWSTANQSGTRASALSHIPEIVWNDSCANPIFAQAFGDDPITFCNATDLPGTTTANPFIEILGSGAGVSSCITTDSGNCSGGYAQPTWQSSAGASFGGRSIPDVSLIATRWLMCSYDTNPCDPSQAPTFAPAATGTVKALQGTSAAAPAMAAIIAMLDQKNITAALPDGRQGLVNPMLYQLAATEYQNSALQGECDASEGTPSASLCAFFDVTAGSNAQPCSVSNYSTNATGSVPASTCATESGDSTGVIEVNGSQDYAASVGLDIASGLGSINAALLIGNAQSSGAPAGLAASASGQTVKLTWTADAMATNGYDIYQGSAPGVLSPTPIQQNVMATEATITGLQLGQSYVFAISAVSSNAISPLSASVQATIVPAAPTGLTVAAAGEGALTVTWTASLGASSYNVSKEGTTPVSLNVSGTSTTYNNLTAGQQYSFVVAAVDSGGTSTASAQVSGTVVPAVPAGLGATAGNATVSLSWSAATGATSYNVYQGTSSGAEGSAPVMTGITSTSANLSGLSNGKGYFFTVAAVNTGGASTMSNEASATPTAPSSGGGGGSIDWLALALLALLVGGRRTAASELSGAEARSRPA